MAITCFTAQAVSGEGPFVTLEITAKDESGDPVEEATVRAAFRKFVGEGEVIYSPTDKNGFVAITHQTHLPVPLSVKKEGYYQSSYRKVNISKSDQLPRSHSIETTLRAIREPRPLVAKRIKNLSIPVENEPVGYDLALGDWVEPHGSGERADLFFRYSKTFEGLRISEEGLEKVRKRRAHNDQPWNEELARFFYGNWSGQLKISFPGEKEGILLVTMEDGYLWESEMHMPHRAREKGYEPEITFEGFMPPKIKELRKGYFLRVRVKERNDQILEANYAKINEEIQFDPRGKISFTYYFNPDVNDRNLEFDPGQNLLEIPDSDVPVRLP